MPRVPRFLTLLLLVMPGAPGPVPAQDASGERAATSCPAADAALGAESSAQAKVRIRRFYSARADRTYLTFAQGPFHASVSWPGQGIPDGLSAQLDLPVPGALLAAALTPADTLTGVLDRSVRMTLTELQAATLNLPRGAPSPRTIPLSAALSSSSFLELARAKSVEFVFRKKTIKVSADARRGLNALYRAMTCAQLSSAARGVPDRSLRIRGRAHQALM